MVVDQSVDISVMNVKVQTHRYSAMTLATSTFLWAIVNVTELKTQLGNSSTDLTVLENSMQSFSRNVSNATPLAKLALTF